MSEEYITDEALSETSDGGAAGSEEKSIKSVLEKELGKEFPDEETALKAVKDTFSHVGKSGKYEKAVKAVMDNKNMTEDEAVHFIQASHSMNLLRLKKMQTNLDQ